MRAKFLTVPLGDYRHVNEEGYCDSCGNGLGLEILKTDQININGDVYL